MFYASRARRLRAGAGEGEEEEGARACNADPAALRGTGIRLWNSNLSALREMDPGDGYGVYI